MPILNNQGITSYARKQPIGREGDLHTEPERVRPMQNPLLAQISTVVYTAAADVSDEIVEDQVFTITVTEPDGTVHTVSHTVTAADDTAGTDADGLAYMAVQMVTDFNATASLYGIATAARPAGLGATGTNGTVVITFDHPGIDYTVDASIAPAVAETTLVDTVATTQAAGGTGIPLGRFVVSGGAGAQNGELLELPDAATDDIVGILARADVGVNQAGSLSTDLDTLPAGYIGGVVEEGEVLMRNNGDTTAAPRAAVYAVVSTTGGDALGEAHVALEGTAQVDTVTPTAAELDFQILIEWTPEGGEKQSVPLLSANPDGTATATEICDAWRVAAATAQADGVLAGFTFGGTATLTITGPAGATFRTSDVGEGVSAVASVAGATYTARVPGARWVKSTAAGAIGPVRIDI